jgi:hypothetical protein
LHNGAGWLTAAAGANIQALREGDAMEQLDRRAQRLIALCMLGCVLFNFPVLAIFNVSGFVLGIPVLYAYIFGAWMLLIALMALAAERGG